ncbi:MULTISPECIES: lysophospholipid acyltransferase family protein [Burkholderia]|uniref:1-acyl-sn-glycerol-3-phosphate acyltransferase n=1 Tax=Burkholderia singularis TaxID=1503053 RepID=A0A238GZB2_9BURK|nr:MULTISPECIES: lysophospholipid acyltransferase family protein [Burkholderia]AOK30551.1 acyl-phosphate glycerol 3-phosphate acyltransferase [Burkholderia sp. Bp7605]SMF98292.1 1-acyl-sn-glycerol-3-phosphate acyltransferase [Burkholderia singularis]
MRFVRSLLFTLYLIVYTIPYAIACLIAFPFMRATARYWMAAGWCKSTIFVARWLNGIRYRIEGLDNLPNGPAVLLSKHQSAWETIALPALMPKPLCFVLKRELLYVPFFGWALGMLQMVYINRKDGKHAFDSVIRQGKVRLDDGAWIIIFPEGTRTPVGSQGKYKTGGARFAVDAGTPVVPIAHNAGHVWPRNSFTKFPGLVTVSIGKPIDTHGLTYEQLNERVENWIETEMRRIDPDAYRHERDARGGNARASSAAST